MTVHRQNVGRSALCTLVASILSFVASALSTGLDTRSHGVTSISFKKMLRKLSAKYSDTASLERQQECPIQIDGLYSS